MSDELSRIVAVLRHYDSVRIAQGVRGEIVLAMTKDPWIMATFLFEIAVYV